MKVKDPEIDGTSYKTELQQIKKKYKLNYEKEATLKIVSKLLYKLDTQQRDSSMEHNLHYYNRGRIIEFFAEAESLFRYFDAEKKGELDIKLFLKMARMLKQIYDAKEIKAFEKEIKIKRLNKMNLPMYLTLLKRKLFEPIADDKEFEKHFNILDMRNENQIDLNRLKTFLRSVGNSVDEKSFEFFLNYYIENKKKLQLDEFTYDNKNVPTHLKKEGFKNMLTYYQNFLN